MPALPERRFRPSHLALTIIVSHRQVVIKTLLDGTRIAVERRLPPRKIGVNSVSCLHTRVQSLGDTLPGKRVECYCRIANGEPIFCRNSVDFRAVRGDD